MQAVDLTDKFVNIKLHQACWLYQDASVKIRLDASSLRLILKFYN